MSGRPIDARVRLARQRREEARREREQRRQQKIEEHRVLERRTMGTMDAGVRTATGVASAGITSRVLNAAGQTLRTRNRPVVHEELLARAKVLAQEGEALSSAGFDATSRQAAERAGRLAEELGRTHDERGIAAMVRKVDEVQGDIDRAAAHQELSAEVQAAFVAALGTDGAIAVDTAASRGGRIVVTTSDGHIEVEIAEAGTEEDVALRFHVAKAGLDRVATDDGVLESCAAEERVVEEIIERVAAVTPKPKRQTAGTWLVNRAARARAGGARR